MSEKSKMSSILKGGRLALITLIILIVISLSSHTITTATARTPYTHARQLATNCDVPIQGDIPGCGSGGGSGGSAPVKPRPCRSAPGSSLCKKGCCGFTKMGNAICC
ncbi:hypothetical protein L2E82_07940 [Cichorium intybus]|uniref:Uncharacterized protein n=1 Tax=Cichorium intybus TaxID=13427 RepID=A0ACB9G562_CICIN|nr:hypothetical protein L2E82_07940 [Cichorium intybus]